MVITFTWNDHHFINRNPALDFANMVVWRGQRGEEDRGLSLDNLRGWARFAGLAEPLPDIGSSLTVRETIDGYFRSGKGWPRLVALYAQVLAADDDPFLSTILHSAVSLAFSPDKERVRVCGNCGWLFLDATRNGNKRWCTSTCSSRTRARRYYARRRSA